MTNIQLQELLEEAYESTFLQSIELLMKNEKDYKQSNFFKQTKIPLTILYEKFFQYKKSSMPLFDEIAKAISNLDVDVLVNKLEEFIVKAEEKERIVDTLNQIIENFNYEALIKQGEEVMKNFNKIQK